MKLMTAKNELPNLTQLNYPCYVSPLPSIPKVVYIPDVNEFEDFSILSQLRNWVIEGYIIDNKFMAIDCMDVDHWIDSSCKRTCEERLKDLRFLVSHMGEYDKFSVLPVDIVHDASEIKALYASYLTDGYEGAIIKNVEATYHFGECENGEIVELKPKSKE